LLLICESLGWPAIAICSGRRVFKTVDVCSVNG
jgi:hypothetical protein